MRVILPSATGSMSHSASSANARMIQNLARFRYQLRLFLRFSENAARKSGVTPQQHQLLLGIAGHTGRGRATISELTEFLQERHNSVVGLVERAALRGLVRKAQDITDRRIVVVSLTALGYRILAGLSKLHNEEIERVSAGLLAVAKARRTSKSRRAARSKGSMPHG